MGKFVVYSSVSLNPNKLTLKTRAPPTISVFSSSTSLTMSPLQSGAPLPQA